jgi:RNA polymerase sigma-70 factor (ECF subfamily)
LGKDTLRAAIAKLPPEQRAAVALFHFEELSVAEVAVALHVPVGTVKTRLMHARLKLRAALQGED